MQRTTLSISSTAEIMITGTCCSTGSRFNRSSTETPSSSGMTMSSKTTSNGFSRRISSASWPFAAEPTRWPSCSRLRIRSIRLSGSSSTTRMRPAGTSTLIDPASQRSPGLSAPLPLRLGLRLQPGHFVERSLTAHGLDLTTEIRKADLIELIDVDGVDGVQALLDEGPRSLLTEEPPLHRAPRARSCLGPRLPTHSSGEPKSLYDERNRSLT